MFILLKIVGDGDAEDSCVLNQGQIFAINHNWIEAVFVPFKVNSDFLAFVFIKIHKLILRPIHYFIACFLDLTRCAAWNYFHKRSVVNLFPSENIRKYSLLLAFLIACSTWSFHLRSLEMVTPRIFAFSTTDRSLPLITTGSKLFVPFEVNSDFLAFVFIKMHALILRPIHYFIGRFLDLTRCAAWNYFHKRDVVNLFPSENIRYVEVVNHE